MRDTKSRNLARNRFVRFSEEDDIELERIAASQGSNVSVLLRSAAIRVYSLPSGGLNKPDVEQNVSNANAPAIGEHPTSEVAS